MAELRFFFGTMGSGKSTLALQIHYNLTQVGQYGLLCTQLDRLHAAVSSRLGVAQPAIEVVADLDLAALARDVIEDTGALHFMVCDEAQFYEPEQIEQLAYVVDKLDVDVFAFGLLTDFRGELFAGTARLLELADVRQEIQVQARCWCNRQATHNARLVGGRQVYDGETVVVGDFDESDVRYELLCRRHWMEGQAVPAAVSATQTGVDLLPADAAEVQAAGEQAARRRRRSAP